MRESVRRRITDHLIPFGCFVGLAVLFLWPALFGDRALLPTDLLMQMAPWADARTEPAAEATRLPWNPLLWDSLAQFYPWREFAARWMRRGVIPLWDPHQFCGTPFLANSQSAVLYPLHFLFLYLPAGLSVARAMALLAATHLTLAGFFSYLWLRALRLSAFAAALGGATFMLSGFAITWLELPSFLTVACWLPLLFLTVHRVLQAPSPSRVAGVGIAVGLVLLGGHLQIAFYCLLGAGLYALVRTVAEVRGRQVAGAEPPGSRERTDLESGLSGQHPQVPTHAAGTVNGTTGRGRRLASLISVLLAAGCLGVMLAAPQLLPAMELSRHSHRVGVASAEGYKAYVGGAMPAGHLIRLFLPEFYGNPTRGDYVAGSPADYTEFAGYVGGVGLLLALVGLLAWRRRPGATLPAVALGLVSLLLALGTPLNWLFYFGIPGFSQSGSPARVLVLFCFAAAWLAGLGAQALLDNGHRHAHLVQEEPEPGEGQRSTLGSRPVAPGSVGIPASVTREAGPESPSGAAVRADRRSLRLPAATFALWTVLLGLALMLSRVWVQRQGGDFGPFLSGNSAALGRVILFALLGLALPIGLQRLGAAGAISSHLADRLGSSGLAAVLIGELWLLGVGFLPLGRLAEVYPSTPLLEALKAGPASGTGRVLPINRNWSLYRHPHALLPPNSALAAGLSDPQGYDSLFPGSFKAFSTVVQGADTAPPENGNMLFLSNVQSPLLPLLAADRLIERAPAAGEGAPPVGQASSSWPVLFEQDHVRVRRYPPALPRAFVAARSRQVTDDSEAEELRRLGASGDLADEVTVTTSVPSLATEGRGGPVLIREEGPNKLALQAGLGAGPGMLVLLDTHVPGWRAADAGSGRRLPLLRVNMTFRGVPLSRPGQSVQMRYEPASFRFGLYLALGAISILLALLVSGGRVSRG